jgi:uncharacterized membrane protein YGL010W
MDLSNIKGTLRRYLDQYATEHSKLSTRVTHMIGIPMIVVSIPVAVVSPLAAAGLFAGGWALQLAGHYIFEKNHPSFTRDPLYLLIGPLWVVVEILDMLGVPLPDYLTPRPKTGTAAAPAPDGEIFTAPN